MKKNWIWKTLILCVSLCGCSKTTGTVDCYSLQVTQGGETFFSESYYSTYAKVYEYRSSKGNALYLGYHLKGYNSVTSQSMDAEIHAYSDRYTSEYEIYSYVGFVGWLTQEQNYYYDIERRIIDSETKWSEYRYESNPVVSDPSAEENSPDNKRAYSCAKKNYYPISATGWATSEGEIPSVTMKLDLIESGIERHSYTILGEDCVVTYTAKWF